MSKNQPMHTGDLQVKPFYEFLFTKARLFYDRQNDI